MTGHLRLSNYGAIKLARGHYRLGKLELRRTSTRSWIATHPGKDYPLVIMGVEEWGTIGDLVRAIQRMRESIRR